uniref:Uncharacterized protein n=1 Tax=viral metagenome TaxID=1070528 RepID=A0A6C0KTW8_9ZZZZ
MESLISSYGLDFPAFRTLLSTTNSLVAGSAALYAYFKEHGVDPQFVPGDLDIWMEDNHDLIALHGSYEQRGNLYRFTNFLLQQGYNVTTKFEVNHDGDYSKVHHISQIFSFMNSDQKEIQLILLNYRKLKEYVQQYFDLSPCMTWWNAKENQMETIHPDTIEHKMHIMSDLEVGSRQLARIQKYEARGFCLQEKPCPAVLERDMRENANMLTGQKAFDVIAYEELDASAFLKESSYHILLQVSDQLQAFHRKTLCDYMQERATRIPGMGVVVDTPNRQSLPSDILNVMPYSDYSIYELVPFVTEREKSIYTVQCYTVDQWLRHAPGALIDVGFSLTEIEELELDEEEQVSVRERLENEMERLQLDHDIAADERNIARTQRIVNVMQEYDAEGIDEEETIAAIQRLTSEFERLDTEHDVANRQETRAAIQRFIDEFQALPAEEADENARVEFQRFTAELMALHDHEDADEDRL